MHGTWFAETLLVHYPQTWSRVPGLLGLLATCIHDGNPCSPTASNSNNQGEIIDSFVRHSFRGLCIGIAPNLKGVVIYLSCSFSIAKVGQGNFESSQ